MPSHRRLLALVGAGTALLALWVGIAAANGVGSLGRPGRSRLPDLSVTVEPPQNKVNQPSMLLDKGGQQPGQGPLWLWQLVQVLVVAALLYGLYRLVRRLIDDFVLVRPAVASTAVGDDDSPEIDLEEMAEGLRTSLAELRTGDDFRGTIVACWRRLEDLAADSGAPRHPWQTTAEYSLDVLAHTPAHRDDLAELAEIYRRACYAAHDPSADDRAHAEACLERLTATLEVTRA